MGEGGRASRRRRKESSQPPAPKKQAKNQETPVERVLYFIWGVHCTRCGGKGSPQLLAVLEDADELLVVEPALGIGWGTLEHDVDLLLGEDLAHGGEEIAELAGVDESSRAVVEGLEGVEDLVLGVGAAEPLTHEGKEHGEVDGAGGLADHLLNDLVLGGLTYNQRNQEQVSQPKPRKQEKEERGGGGYQGRTACP